MFNWGHAAIVFFPIVVVVWMYDAIDYSLWKYKEYHRPQGIRVSVVGGCLFVAAILAAGFS